MNKKAQQLIRLMFESRQMAHKGHFMTTVDARHRALGEFYDAIGGLADRFTEVCIAKFGKPDDMDMSVSDENTDNIAELLRRHMDWIETNRSLAVGSYSPIQAIIDDIIEQYLRTIYKLENLL